MSLPEVIKVMIAMNNPIKATLNPVCACVINITIAHKKITQLTVNFALFVIASLGSGYVDASTAVF